MQEEIYLVEKIKSLRMINEQRDMTADDTQRHGDSLQRHQDRTQASGDTMQVAGDTMQVAEDHNRQRKKKVGSKNVADFKGKKSEVDGFLAYMRQLRALCESTMRLDDVMLNSLIEKLIAEIPPEKVSLLLACTHSACRHSACTHFAHTHTLFAHTHTQHFEWSVFFCSYDRYVESRCVASNWSSC